MQAGLKVVIFGVSGMVGRGVLRECCIAPEVEKVLCVSRRETGIPSHTKVHELVHQDFMDFTPIAEELKAYDACFWCMGVSSAGMSEADFTRVTYDYTMAGAQAMVHPGMTFIYVSGQGTDSTGNSRTMWARIKGKSERAIMGMPFKGGYAFRPGIIQPLHGITSQTTSYRNLYKVLGPFIPCLKALLPNQITTTERIGQAMIQCALQGYTKKVCEPRDINALARAHNAAAQSSVS